MILGYVVGGLILLWCLYQLTLLALYQAEKVKADEKLMQEIRLIGLVPKPRYPVSRALFRRFINIAPKEEDAVALANMAEDEADTAQEEEGNANHTTQVVANSHQHSEPSFPESSSVYSNSDTSDSGSDLLRHVMEDSEQESEFTSPGLISAHRGAYMNSSPFVDLEANVKAEDAQSPSTRNNSVPYAVNAHSGESPPSRQYIVLDRLNTGISDNSSEMSEYIAAMLDHDSESTSTDEAHSV